MMKFIFGMQINIEVSYKLILSFLVCVIRHAQSTQNKKFAYFSNISKKTWGLKNIFCLQIKPIVSCKLVVSNWVCIARHTQSTQNNKFATSLQYLKENVKDKLNFFPAGKHQRFCHF